MFVTAQSSLQGLERLRIRETPQIIAWIVGQCSTTLDKMQLPMIPSNCYALLEIYTYMSVYMSCENESTIPSSPSLLRSLTGENQQGRYRPGEYPL